jgi:anti-anti-sigma regulatory factor
MEQSPLAPTVRFGSIALVIASPQVLKILEITGLTDVFSIYATEAEAAAS